MRSRIALPFVLLGALLLAACGSRGGAVQFLPTVLEFVQPVDGEVIQLPAGSTPTTTVRIAVSDVPDAGGVLRLIVNDDEDGAQQRSADTEDEYTFSNVLLVEGTNTLRAEYVYGERVPSVEEITVEVAFASGPSTDVPPPPAISFIEPVDGAVIGPEADLDGDLSNGVQIRVRAQTEDVPAGTDVTLLVDTSSVGTAATDGSGVATFDSVTLGEGVRTLTVRVETDGGLAEQTITVTVEFGGCEVTLLPAPLAEGCDVTAETEDLAPEEAGVSRAFTVQTTCSSVTLTRNGTEVGTEDVANGEATFTVALEEGENRLVAEASDAASGQTGTSGEQVYDVLTEAPAVSLDPSLAGTILPSDDLAPDEDGITLLVFGESEAGEGTEVSILADGEEVATATVTAAGTFSVEVTFEDEGAVVLMARVADRCGNEGESEERTLDIFLEAPPLVVTAPASGTTVGPAANESTETGEFALTFSVEADGLDEGTAVTVECEDGAGEFEERGAGVLAADGSADVLVVLEEGANVCRASVLEPLVVRSPEVNVIVDTIAPEVEITAPADGSAFAEANQSVTITVTDADPSPEITVLLTGGVDEERTYSPTVTDGTVTLTVELFQGQNTVTVTATDAGGNVGEDEITLFLDADPPLITALVPTEGAVLEEGDLASVAPLRLDATANVLGFFGELELCASTNGGTPSCRTLDTEGDTDAFNLAVVGGANTLTWSATDRTGRVTTLAVSFTVDVDLPTLTITSPADGLRTNDTSPIDVVVETDLAEGTEVTLELNGAEIATGAVDEDGNVTFSAVELQDNAEHVFMARATDARGEGASQTVTVTTDTIPPTLVFTAPTDGALLGAGDGTVDGSTLTIDVDLDTDAEDGQVVTVTRNGTELGSFTVSGGEASGTVTLPEGASTLTATVEDLAGNETTTSITVTVLLTPLELAFTAPTDGVTLNADDDADTDTAGLQYDVAVSTDAEDGTEVSFTVNGTDAGTATVAGGAASLRLTLPEGSVTIGASVTDAANNETTASVSVTVDSIPPTLAFTSPDDGALLGAGDGTVDGSSLTIDVALDTDAEDGQVVTITRNGTELGSFTVSGGEASGTVTLSEGASTLTATVEDQAGNETTTSITVTVDLTPPTLAFTDPADGALLNASDDADSTETGFQYDVAVSTDAADGSEVTFTVNGTEAGTATVAGGAASTRLTLPQGTVTIGAAVSDAAGNEATASITVTVDSVPPTISIDDPEDGDVLGLADGTPGATGLLYEVMVTTDAEDGQEVTIIADGDERGTLTVTNGEASGDILLPEGTYTLTAMVEDAAGNPASASIEITVDITPPTLVFSAPEDGDVLNANSDEDPGTSGLQTTVTVLTDAEDGQTVTITDGDGTVLGSFEVQGGEASGQVTLPEGTVELTASVSDAAGNESDETITVIVDSVPPTLAFTAPADEAVLLRADGTPVAGGLETTVTLTTDAEDGQEVTVSADGNVVGTLTVSGGTATGTLTLPDGVDYALSAEVEDAAGNGASAEIEITVDTVEPVLTFIDPADGSSTDESGPAGQAVVRTIDVQASNIDGRTVTLTSSLTGTAVADTFTATGSTQTVEVTLTPGTHELTMAASSTFGNPGVSGTITFVVDVAPATPEVEVTVVDRLRGDIDVTWTQPGVSTIDTWEMRRSTSPITTEAQWDAATVVGTYPGGAGPAVEEFRDLDFQRTYYFAVRATDTDDRESGIGTDSGFVGFLEHILETSLASSSTMAVVGDSNGSGFADVAVSVTNDSVLVIYGGPDVTELNTHTIPSPITGGSFGARLIAPGDINGDGFSDLVVAAPTAAPGGKAFVYFGSADGFDDVPDVEITLNETGALLMLTRVSGAGNLVDVDEEGINDLVLSSNFVLGQVGQVYIIPGRADWPETIELTSDPVANSMDGSDPTHIVTITGPASPISIGARVLIGNSEPASMATGEPVDALFVTAWRTAVLGTGRLFSIPGGAIGTSPSGYQLENLASDSIDGVRSDGNWGTATAGAAVVPALEPGGPLRVLVSDTATSNQAPGRHVDIVAFDQDLESLTRTATYVSSSGTRIFAERIAGTSSMRQGGAIDLLLATRDSTAAQSHELEFIYATESGTRRVRWSSERSHTAVSSLDTFTDSFAALFLLSRSDGQLLILH